MRATKAESVARVSAASSRIVRLLDELRKEKYEPAELQAALVDAGVRLWRFYNPRLLTSFLLRDISRYVLEMAEDEENQRKYRLKARTLS